MDLLVENQPVGQMQDVVSSDGYVDSFLSGAASANVVIAAGVSSGKDSNTMAWELRDYLAAKDSCGYVIFSKDFYFRNHRFLTLESEISDFQ